MRDIKTFNLNVNGKTLDYRLGQELNLDEVKSFFKKKYSITKLWQGGRHILGLVEKDDKDLFLKLSTTEGISIVTRIEYNWNEQFNKQIQRTKSDFWVPRNYDCGLYNDNLFYLITDRFNGELLAARPDKQSLSQELLVKIPKIIEFSELIQTLNIHPPAHSGLSSGLRLRGRSDSRRSKTGRSGQENSNYQQWFVDKAIVWYEDIPIEVRDKYNINDLLSIVKTDNIILEKRPRHGDFTPWHIFSLKTGQLGLIDGEHAKENGVEYYDIAYFIQRVYSVLDDSDLAKKILDLLKEEGYNLDKLRVVLAARAIGGFLDESLKESPNYELTSNFKEWTINL